MEGGSVTRSPRNTLPPLLQELQLQLERARRAELQREEEERRAADEWWSAYYASYAIAHRFEDI